MGQNESFIFISCSNHRLFWIAWQNSYPPHAFHNNLNSIKQFLRFHFLPIFACCPLGNHHSNKSEVKSHCGFSLHSLMVNDDGHFPYKRLTLFMSFFKNNLPGLMFIFKSNSLFFLFGCFSSLHFLDIIPLHVRGSVNICSYLIGYLFGLFGLLITYSLLHIRFSLWCFICSVWFCFLCLGKILAQSNVLQNFAYVFF